MGFDDNVGAHAQLFQTCLIRSQPGILEVVCCANVKTTAKYGKPLGAPSFRSRKLRERFLCEYQAPAECKIAYTSEGHYRWLPKQDRKVMLNDRSEAERARRADSWQLRQPPVVFVEVHGHPVIAAIHHIIIFPIIFDFSIMIWQVCIAVSVVLVPKIISRNVERRVLITIVVAAIVVVKLEIVITTIAVVPKLPLSSL